MAAGVSIERSGFARTQRKDYWRLQWFAYFAGLGFFLIVYPTWALLQNAHFRYDNYLSPFYSPELYGSAKAWLGAGKAPFWPSWLVWSPAFLILWAPAGFRFTCYYYRGAYYKAFWADPINCAVGEPRISYWGENFFRSSSKTSTAISCISRSVHSRSSPRRVEGDVVHRRRRASNISASASARSSSQ